MTPGIYEMKTITQSHFARLCKINRSSVSRAVQRGRLVLVDGGIQIDVDGNDQPALEAAAISLWTASASSDPHHQARFDQEQAQREKIEQLQSIPDQNIDLEETDDDDPDLASINKRIKKADAKKRENDARTAEIQRLALEGDYLQREAVDYALRDHSAILRRELDNLADRLSPVVHPLETVEEAHAAIAAAADEILRIMHQSMANAKQAARELQ